jgi:hypothetical protein
MEQDVKKTSNLLGIIAVSTILCLTQISCIAFDYSNEKDYYETENQYAETYLKVVNNHELPITKVDIDFIAGYRYYETFTALNIPSEKSETFFLILWDDLYSAEVIVYFGDMYSYKELKFNPGRTTTATLNVNGILE